MDLGRLVDICCVSGGVEYFNLGENKREKTSVFVSVLRFWYMYYNHSTWQGYSIFRFYDVASKVFLKNE